MSTRRKAHDWDPFRADERPVRLPFSLQANRLALVYANSYHVGMSSLGFQRTWEVVNGHEGWCCERFFLDGEDVPRSIETGTALNQFRAIAFSVSFEEDYVNLLRLLDRSGVALRRQERRESDPLVLLGGSCASINPLPMASLVDAFALGAAENVVPELLAALADEGGGREAVLERLAHRPGFFVPAHHDPEAGDLPEKLRKLELTAEQMKLPGALPTTAIVTPRTEFADKFLVEMSRGCPEKCRYCWATFGMGKFRFHPTDYILSSFEEARRVTNQLGFVATAVGDHPEIERILRVGLEMGFRSSVSSIRIPAVTDGVLDALHRSGDRAITLAPETGTDELRVKMGKFVTNAQLLEKVAMIFGAGFTQLKLYFIVGLPDETNEDIDGILELATEIRSIMLASARRTGVMGHLHLGTNVLIPKPYTPWQREAMDEERSLKRKLARLKRGAARLPNVSLGAMSPRQAAWQTYISRAGSGAGEAIVRAARGATLGELLRDFAPEIHAEVYQPLEGSLRWHFMGTGLG